MLVYIKKRLVVNGLVFPGNSLCDMPEHIYNWSQGTRNWRDFYELDNFPNDVDQVFDAGYFVSLQQEIELEKKRKRVHPATRGKAVAGGSADIAARYPRLQVVSAGGAVVGGVAEVLSSKSLQMLINRINRQAEELRLLVEQNAWLQSELHQLQGTGIEKQKTITALTKELQQKKDQVAELKKHKAQKVLRHTDEELDIIYRQNIEIKRLNRQLRYERYGGRGEYQPGYDTRMEDFQDHSVSKVQGRLYACIGHGSYRAMPVIFDDR